MPIDLSSAVSGGISSAANGLLGLAGNAIAYSQQKKLAAQAQEYTRENMATQFKNSRSMVQDSPGLTVAGLRAAGLNPAFANGSMTGNIASSPSASTPSAPQSPLQGLGSSAIEAANQSRLTDAQADWYESEAEKNRELLPGQLKELNENIILIQKNQNSVDTSISQMQKNIEQAQSVIDNNQADTAQKKEQTRIMVETWDKQKDVIASQLKETAANIENLRSQAYAAKMNANSQAKVSSAMSSYYNSLIAVNKQQVEILKAQQRISDKEAEKIEKSFANLLDKIKAETDIAKAEALVKQFEGDNPALTFWRNGLTMFFGALAGASINIGAGIVSKKVGMPNAQKELKMFQKGKLKP